MKTKVTLGNPAGGLGAGIGCFFQLLGLAILLLVFSYGQEIMKLLFAIFKVK